MVIMHLQASSSGVPVLRNHQKLPTMTCKLLKFCNKTDIPQISKAVKLLYSTFIRTVSQNLRDKVFSRLISILTLVTDSYNTSFSKTHKDFEVF
jgi:hypothetical protein